MSTMLASVMLAAAEVNAAPQVACDLRKASSPGGANEVCGSSRPPHPGLRLWPRATLLLTLAVPAADFCNFKCAFYNASSDLPTDSGKPQNITLYRITPFNVSGIVNKNTGDAPGDVGFFLERKNITQECAKDPHSFGCFLDGDNMYGKFTVEVDGLWGPYQECNPVNVGGTGGSPWSHGGGSGWSDTTDFQCGQNCLNPTKKDNCTATSSNPWDKPRNGSSYDGGFSCFCGANDRHLKTVGREPRGGHHYGGGTVNLPMGWYRPTPQCEEGFEPPCLVEGPRSRYGQQCKERGGCLTGTEHQTVHGWSFDSTSSMACDACTSDPLCTGWAITSPDNTTATLFHGKTSVKKDINCVSATRYQSHYHGGGGRSWYGVDAGSGYWYSTPEASQCAAGAPLGTDGCTWRVVETVKYANASCIDGKVDDAVERLGKACFDTCPQPLDRISDCAPPSRPRFLVSGSGPDSGSGSGSGSRSRSAPRHE